MELLAFQVAQASSVEGKGRKQGKGGTDHILTSSSAGAAVIVPVELYDVLHSVLQMATPSSAKGPALLYDLVLYKEVAQRLWDGTTTSSSHVCDGGPFALAASPLRTVSLPEEVWHTLSGLFPGLPTTRLARCPRCISCIHRCATSHQQCLVVVDTSHYKCLVHPPLASNSASAAVLALPCAAPCTAVCKTL